MLSGRSGSGFYCGRRGILQERLVGGLELQFNHANSFNRDRCYEVIRGRNEFIKSSNCN